MSLPVLTASMTFEQASRAVLAHLREHLPMGFWSVTRLENARQSYLYLDDDNVYGLAEGGSHPWADSYCIHMAAGTAPTVAPDSRQVPLYASAAVNDAVQIRSYAGAVITETDGTVFGALCGIDPEAKTDDPALVAAAPLLQLLGQLLTMVLSADRARQRSDALAQDAALVSETDALTGLYNRRAWERVLAEESSRFAQLGDPTVIAMTDLDFLKTINDRDGHAAGDAYIRRAAQALSRGLQRRDVVARLGGDEFGVLLRSCDEAGAQLRVDELYRSLAQAGVAGSVGWAPITILRGLPAALEEADQAMYAAKRARRALRSDLAVTAQP